MKLVKMMALIVIAAAACGPPAGSPATTPAAPEKSASTDDPVSNSPRRPREIVQPVKIEKQEVSAPTTVGDPNGVEGDPNGVEEGVVGDDLGGVITAPPPPPPPPPRNIAPTQVEAHRIAGTKNIIPDVDTKAAIAKSGKAKVIGSYKLCVHDTGEIASVIQLKSTGFPPYDQKIIQTIRAQWRYRPYMSDGKPAAVCTAVTFIYSQDLPPPPPPGATPSSDATPPPPPRKK